MATLGKAKTEALETLATETDVVASWLSGARAAKVEGIASALRELALGETPDVTPSTPVKAEDS